jgi:hypothetical protein
MEKSDAVITIRVPAAIKDALEDLARRDRRKLSAFCALKLEDVVAAAGLKSVVAEAPVVESPPPPGWDVPTRESLAAAVAQYEQQIAEANTAAERSQARRNLKSTRWLQANPGKTIADAAKALRKAKP